MSDSCAHPLCHEQMARFRMCCKRHYALLSDDIRDRLRGAAKAGLSAFGSLRLEAIEHFRSRMIGDHDIVKCRRPDCTADIVWLDGRNSGVPVDPEHVKADDTAYDPKRHRRHSIVCPVLPTN